jgi:hypothetical protein
LVYWLRYWWSLPAGILAHCLAAMCSARCRRPNKLIVLAPLITRIRHTFCSLVHHEFWNYSPPKSQQYRPRHHDDLSFKVCDKNNRCLTRHQNRISHAPARWDIEFGYTLQPEKRRGKAQKKSSKTKKTLYM